MGLGAPPPLIRLSHAARTHPLTHSTYVHTRVHTYLSIHVLAHLLTAGLGVDLLTVVCARTPSPLQSPRGRRLEAEGRGRGKPARLGRTPCQQRPTCASHPDRDSHCPRALVQNHPLGAADSVSGQPQNTAHDCSPRGHRGLCSLGSSGRWPACRPWGETQRGRRARRPCPGLRGRALSSVPQQPAEPSFLFR